jgi:hypothetical protein
MVAMSRAERRGPGRPRIGVARFTAHLTRDNLDTLRELAARAAKSESEVLRDLLDNAKVKLAAVKRGLLAEASKRAVG